MYRNVIERGHKIISRRLLNWLGSHCKKSVWWMAWLEVAWLSQPHYCSLILDRDYGAGEARAVFERGIKVYHAIII